MKSVSKRLTVWIEAFVVLLLLAIMPFHALAANSACCVVKATNPTYTAKEKIEKTNAVLVANIKKNSGAKVNYVGVVMYDAADPTWTALVDKTFPVTNVSAKTTSFHAWFDVNSELKITLKPGTTYRYRIFTKIDGVKYVSEYWYFTTKSDPVVSTVKASTSNSNVSSSTASSSSKAVSSSTASSSSKAVSSSTTASSSKATTVSTGKVSSTLKQKIAQFTTDSRWKNGAKFSNPDANGKNGTQNKLGKKMGAYGCLAYAYDFVRYMSGNNKLKPSNGTKYYDLTKIKAGDVVYTYYYQYNKKTKKYKKVEHWACVMSVIKTGSNSVTVKVCEGGYNGGKGRGHETAHIGKVTYTKNGSSWKNGKKTVGFSRHYSYNK